MLEITTEEKNNTVTLSLSGEITMITANDIDNHCKKFINKELSVLALDLKYVRFIDSFGISRIIKQSKTFNGKGTDFVLVNMNEEVSQIFKIATFDRLFTIMTTAEFTEKYLA